MRIELLVVPDCPNQAPAADLIATAVADTGVPATVTVRTINSQAQARRNGFTGSPTIRLDGLDPFARPDAPVALACRLYVTPAGLRGVPALEDLHQALQQAAARDARPGTTRAPQTDST